MSARFWKVDFEEEHIQDFLIGRQEMQETEGLAEDTPVYVDEHKVFHGEVGGDFLLIFATDGRDEDRTIQHKIREGSARIETALRGNTLGYIKDNLEELLGELIFTRFKISFVGSGGVGKSTLLRLLFGREPAPGGYVPTINVAVDSSETIQFGTFLVTIWDFAGQAVFQDLWSFYFQGTDVIFLITDSSFRNVMQTKSLMRNIKKEAPAVPLFIVANKQDLPESMAGDKIQRLLGAPTFSMVATDKTRREEFIRFMLEVAAKTVGVQLPNRPISEMITVRRKTEEIDRPELQRDRDITESGFEEVPLEGEEEDAKLPIDTSHAAVAAMAEDKGAAEGDGIEADVAAQVPATTKILNLILMLNNKGNFQNAYHLDYAEEAVDTTTIASLISALDSFGGIDAVPEGQVNRTDALETIEHEGNLVMVEKSRHFVMALIATNDNKEVEQRKKMSALLVELEQEFEDMWDDWEKSEVEPKEFETSIFTTLEEFPLMPVHLDYIVRVREAGRPLPFQNRDMGRAIVQVQSEIDGSESVGNLVRSLDLPREKVIGSLQILNKFGWVDFQVEIGPTSHLKRSGNVDSDIVKIYGPVVLEFVELCDGNKQLEEIVKEINSKGKKRATVPSMGFVATKLVLKGVLEVVA